MKGINIIFTKHSIKRMQQRGIDPKTVISYLTKFDNHYLSKIKHGYELIIPYKGRLIGDLIHNKYIIKTYNFPNFTQHKTCKTHSIKISGLSVLSNHA